MRDKYADVYMPMRQQLQEIKDTVERGKRELINAVSTEVIEKSAHNLRKQVIRNLTKYTETGVNDRGTLLEEEFWLMELLIGFKWNKDGSFTEDGAIKQIKKDLSIKEHKYRLEVAVNGVLQELELGIVNWNNLRRFFYSEGIRAAIKMFFPIGWEDIYSRLATLFQMGDDIQRPYISQPVLDNTEYMDEAMKDSIEKVFPNGEWDRPRLSKRRGRR